MIDQIYFLFEYSIQYSILQYCWGNGWLAGSFLLYVDDIYLGIPTFQIWTTIRIVSLISPPTLSIVQDNHDTFKLTPTPAVIKITWIMHVMYVYSNICYNDNKTWFQFVCVSLPMLHRMDNLTLLDNCMHRTQRDIATDSHICAQLLENSNSILQQPRCWEDAFLHHEQDFVHQR